MNYLLLLVNADGAASASELIVRELREFPGEEGLSVHFRPVRNDVLFQSAKLGSGIGYRVLLGEGLVRSQLWVEYEVRGPHVNVTGRSADLLFALALITSRWKKAAGDYPVIAATGVLSADEALVGVDAASAVSGVDHIEAKVAAAARALAGEREGVIFYPASDRARVETWCATAALPPHIHLEAVATLDDALQALGIELEKVYLGNPYRGLEYFDYCHRSVFFGRDGETRDLVAQLLRREAAGTPGVLVEGASGSGKSSFLRAGVLPALVNPRSQSPELDRALGDRPFSETAGRAIWHPALLPAGAAEDAVARSIHRVWRNLPEFADAPVTDTAGFEGLVQLWCARWPKDRRFVWLLDQLEELFNLALGEAVIESFGRFLLTLQTKGAWTLASIRADAVPSLKRYASLRGVFGSNEGQYYLAGLGPTALDDVICRPAKAAGLTFGVSPNGKRLDRVLREDAYRDHESALPLLQFTLDELYRRRSGRELTYAAYEELGGLPGTVATIASSALKRAPEGSLTAASRLFRSLVTVDETGMATRRYALRSEIAEDQVQEGLLAALINARLCVSAQREGLPVIALAHEAVLRTWPELIEWLKQESRLLQLRALAEHDARLWQQHARSDAWLAPSGKLAALEPLESTGIQLSEPTRHFIERSRRRVQRNARLKQAGVAAAILLAITASVTGLIAVSKQREAESNAVQALRAKDRATVEADSARATADFLAAIFHAPTPEGSLGRLITARELLEAAARRLRTNPVAAPEVRARLTEQVGNAYREIGEYDRAVPLLKSAIDQYHALPNAPIEDRADAYTALGELYEARYKWASAARALTQAMTLEAGLPAAHRSAMPNLVYARVEIGAADFSAAKAALDQAARILGNPAHVPNQEDYLILMNYSRLYMEQGKFESAERYGLEALTAQSRILGSADPSAINTALNLGLMYMETDDLVRAEKYDRRALGLAKTMYGDSNPVYARVLGDYADIQGSMGKSREAEKLLRQVLQIRLRTLGPSNTLTGYAYYNLGNAVADQGRLTEALGLIRRSQTIWESSEGRQHPDVAWALDMEVRLLTELRRPADAVPLALRSLHISQHAYGPTHPNVARAWKRLGEADTALGRYSDAMDALQRALKISESAFGKSNDKVAECLDSYAKALQGAHRSPEAKAALARAAAIRAHNRVAGVPQRLPESD